jgi:hypothetical protein
MPEVGISLQSSQARGIWDDTPKQLGYIPPWHYKKETRREVKTANCSVTCIDPDFFEPFAWLGEWQGSREPKRQLK